MTPHLLGEEDPPCRVDLFTHLSQELIFVRLVLVLLGCGLWQTGLMVNQGRDPLHQTHPPAFIPAVD